jgi:hypothetical protein
MFVSPAIKARVETKIRECIAAVKAKYNVDMKYPTVVFLTPFLARDILCLDSLECA